ncbi:MAG: hypothetical protein KKD39_02010, partial [Candidatus Altiarchaeota archaeon]|nr:hypothetical protein [Candidatus Altiarchaeota archaeon]
GKEYRGMPEFLKRLGIAPTHYILKGYFYDRPGDLRIRNVDQKAIELTFGVFMGIDIVPPMEFLSMIVETAKGIMPEHCKDPNYVRLIPMVTDMGKTTLQECLGELQARQDQVTQLPGKGVQELMLVEDTGEGKVVKDDETCMLAMYYPRNADRTQVGQWMEQQMTQI